MGNLCTKISEDEKPIKRYYFVYDLQNNKYEYTSIRWDDKIYIKEYT